MAFEYPVSFNSANMVNEHDIRPAMRPNANAHGSRSVSPTFDPNKLSGYKLKSAHDIHANSGNQLICTGVRPSLYKTIFP